MTSIFCRCGAQWHSPYIDGNLQIAQHESQHGLVSREEFVRLGFTNTGPRPRRRRRYPHRLALTEASSLQTVAPRPKAAAAEALTPQQELAVITIELGALVDRAQQLQHRLERLTVVMPWLVRGRGDGGEGPA
jgi:hypothetical protein